MNWLPTLPSERWKRRRAWFILAIVVAIAYVPGAVTLAMLISGNA